QRALLACALLATLAACTAPQQPAAPAADVEAFAGAHSVPLAIATLQGQGSASEYVGREVVIEGVVTAPMRALGGVFVQDPGGDGDPRTSEAVFVAWPDRDTAPAAGTRVR